MARVTALCRDHLDNIIFEVEVETIEDEKAVHEECRKYGGGAWVDFIVEEGVRRCGQSG